MEGGTPCCRYPLWYPLYRAGEANLPATSRPSLTLAFRSKPLFDLGIPEYVFHIKNQHPGAVLTQYIFRVDVSTLSLEANAVLLNHCKSLSSHLLFSPKP